MKKILILGIDGYIGFPLSQHLERLGHEVWGLDNFVRRTRAGSLIPGARSRRHKNFFFGNAGKLPDNLPEMDCIVHLAEQPSAPWSMRSAEHAHQTQKENVLGTLDLLWSIREKMPNAHLLKIGTMGEYGTPEIPIPEGYIEDGPMNGMMFPRQPGSFYHLSKVFDSMNIDFACKTWDLRSTDIMQGIVFGLNYWDNELTRFDYDQYFGTVINRFCLQGSIGYPLTVYGGGNQKRGFLPLSDSIACLTLAIENPPEEGEYRVFNQYADILSVNEIAQTVSKITGTKIDHIKNPRKEKENHTYETSNKNLRDLGYEKKWFFEREVEKLIIAIHPFTMKADKNIIKPTHSWS